MSIFAKIISGAIPCHKVFEDEHTFAFLDINPTAPGHTLVVPKEAKSSLHELSDESGAALGRVLPRICRAVMLATGCQAYNILQNNGSAAGQSVFHVHFHIIPKPNGVDADGGGQPGHVGLGIGWKTAPIDHAAGAALAAQIAGHLAK